MYITGTRWFRFFRPLARSSGQTRGARRIDRSPYLLTLLIGTLTWNRKEKRELMALPWRIVQSREILKPVTWSPTVLRVQTTVGADWIVTTRIAGVRRAARGYSFHVDHRVRTPALTVVVKLINHQRVRKIARNGDINKTSSGDRDYRSGCMFLYDRSPLSVYRKRLPSGAHSRPKRVYTRFPRPVVTRVLAIRVHSSSTTASGFCPRTN